MRVKGSKGVKAFLQSCGASLNPVEPFFWTFRTFIFPLRIKGGKPVPLVPFLVAVFFCTVNGAVQTYGVLLSNSEIRHGSQRIRLYSGKIHPLSRRLFSIVQSRNKIVILLSLQKYVHVYHKSVVESLVLCLVGIVTFLSGMYINIRSDILLTQLRGGSTGEYKIPRGGS